MKIAFVSPFPKDKGKESASIRINDIRDILGPLTDKLHIIEAECPSAGTFILKLIIQEIMAWCSISWKILWIPKDIKYVFMRGRLSTLIIPLFVSWYAGQKSIVILESRGQNLVDYVYGKYGKILSPLYILVEWICFHLAYKLVALTPQLTIELINTQYRKKTSVFPLTMRYISDDFKITTPIKERSRIVGYIGRFSKEKGIERLVRLIKAITSRNDDIFFLLIGDGPMFEYAKKELNSGKVHMTGWVDRKEIPYWLNTMRILLLPSDYEGLSTTLLEAIACGTPVFSSKDQLATINDIEWWINNEVIESLSRGNTDTIDKEFRLKPVQQRWQNLLENLEEN